MTVKEIEKVLEGKKQWLAKMKRHYREQKKYAIAKEYELRQFELMEILHALRSEENFTIYQKHVDDLSK